MEGTNFHKEDDNSPENGSAIDIEFKNKLIKLNPENYRLNYDIFRVIDSSGLSLTFLEKGEEEDDNLSMIEIRYTPRNGFVQLEANTYSLNGTGGLSVLSAQEFEITPSSQGNLSHIIYFSTFDSPLAIRAVQKSLATNNRYVSEPTIIPLLIPEEQDISRNCSNPYITKLNLLISREVIQMT